MLRDDHQRGTHSDALSSLDAARSERRVVKVDADALGEMVGDTRDGLGRLSADVSAAGRAVADVEAKPIVPGSPFWPADGCHAQYDEFFESIYKCAEGDPTRVPWADCHANPLMVEWLNREAWSVVRCGCRAVVVGCGLGDDVAELARRGYDALGLDVSPTAIRWAARRHAAHADRFVLADMLNLPSRLWGRFDLVVEINTIQSVEPRLRASVVSGISRLLSPRGAVLAVARGRSEHEALDAHDGPPWPLTTEELTRLMTDASLCAHGPVCELHDREVPPKRRVIGVFTR